VPGTTAHGGVALLLVAVSTAATWIPVPRAANIATLEALKDDG